MSKHDYNIFARIYALLFNTRDFFADVQDEPILKTLLKTIPFYLAISILISIILVEMEPVSIMIFGLAYFIALPAIMLIVPLILHFILKFMPGEETTGTIGDTYKAVIYITTYLHIVLAPLFLLLPFLSGNLPILVIFMVAALLSQVLYLIILSKALSELHNVKFGQAVGAYILTMAFFKVIGYILEKVIP